MELQSKTRPSFDKSTGLGQRRHHVLCSTLCFSNTTFTVAILAHGTSWAVAVTQAFFQVEPFGARWPASCARRRGCACGRPARPTTARAQARAGAGGGPRDAAAAHRVDGHGAAPVRARRSAAEAHGRGSANRHRCAQRCNKHRGHSHARPQSAAPRARHAHECDATSFGAEPALEFAAACSHDGIAARLATHCAVQFTVPMCGSDADLCATIGSRRFRQPDDPTRRARMSSCRDPGSNRGPSDLRSDALPTELSRRCLR